ncbi:MAG: ABC transporter ATP-binding protein [Planctomycetota bacterium]
MIDAVSVEIAKGRVGLLGPNGAGKSTLVKCLLGLVRPNGGRGSVLGFDIASNPLAVRQQVGYLPEVDCHIPGQTAAEFVAYAAELTGLSPRDAKKRAHEVLDYVGIGEERYRLVDTFSTGMKQRVKLAQAIVHDPDLLLLDEPTNGLDPEGRERMIALVRDLGKTHGIGLLYSSHLLGDVEAVCDEVVILRMGKVLAQGKIEVLKQQGREGFEVRWKGQGEGFVRRIAEGGVDPVETAPGCLQIHATGEKAQEVWRVVFEAARDEEVQVRLFRPLRSSLEDVFLDALEGEAPGGGPGIPESEST